MKKVFCLNPISKSGLDLLKGQYQVTDHMEESEAILVRSANMHDLELPPKLLAIARAGAGVNNIPINACTEKGIVVFNSPGANANGVKEMVIAAMLLASRNLVEGINWVQTIKGEPEVAALVEKGKKQFVGTEIQGKTLGIIGLGAIGYRVANAAVGMDMEVYGYDPFIPVKCAWNLSRKVKHVESIEEIFEKCDYITVHVPLNDSTREIINAEAFRKMKQGVVLLNFARDVLVDEDALKEALESGKVKKYITDFPNQRVVALEGVLAIPHLGASTEESEDNCAAMAVEELMDYLENGNIENSVNYPSCSLGVLQSGMRLAVAHYNKPNVLSSITALLGDRDVNIEHMLSKSRGEYSYALFDTSCQVPAEVISKLEKMDYIISVRAIMSNNK